MSSIIFFLTYSLVMQLELAIYSDFLSLKKIMFHRVYQRAIMCNCLPTGERFIKTEISPDCWWKQRCPYIALVHLSGFSFKFFINIDHELFFVSINSLRFQTIPWNPAKIEVSSPLEVAVEAEAADSRGKVWLRVITIV